MLIIIGNIYNSFLYDTQNIPEVLVLGKYNFYYHFTDDKQSLELKLLIWVIQAKEKAKPAFDVESICLPTVSFTTACWILSLLQSGRWPDITVFILDQSVFCLAIVN